jgi:hypothetical protein
MQCPLGFMQDWIQDPHRYQNLWVPNSLVQNVKCLWNTDKKRALHISSTDAIFKCFHLGVVESVNVNLMTDYKHDCIKVFMVLIEIHLLDFYCS